MENIKTPRSTWSYIFVAVQFAALIYLAITGPMLPPHTVFMNIVLAGVVLGVWALASIKAAKLSIFPEAKEGAELSSMGPYRFIRHPMYLSLMIVGAAWLLNHFSTERLLAYAILVGNLVAKLQHEERLLLAHFPAYKAYCDKTQRLLPFIY